MLKYLTHGKWLEYFLLIVITSCSVNHVESCLERRYFSYKFCRTFDLAKCNLILYI